MLFVYIYKANNGERGSLWSLGLYSSHALTPEILTSCSYDYTNSQLKITFED